MMRFAFSFWLILTLFLSGCSSLANVLGIRWDHTRGTRTESQSGSSSNSAGSNSSQPSRPASSSNTNTGNPGAATQPAATGTSTSTPAVTTGSPGHSVISRPSGTSTITIPLPNIQVSPVPIGIPVPIPLPLPVGIALPHPDIRPTPFPLNVTPTGTQPPATSVSAPPAEQNPYFQLDTVTITRHQDLSYEVRILGEGLGVVESYTFLQAVIGPFELRLIEKDLPTTGSGLTALAIGEREISFNWSPSRGGPTSSDKFQLVFQVKGYTQVFLTTELDILLH